MRQLVASGLLVAVQGDVVDDVPPEVVDVSSGESEAEIVLVCTS